MLALVEIFSISETPEWSRTTGEITTASADIVTSRNFVSFGRTVPLRRSAADEEVKSSGDSDRTPHASPEQGRVSLPVQTARKQSYCGSRRRQNIPTATPPPLFPSTLISHGAAGQRAGLARAQVSGAHVLRHDQRL